MNNIIDVSKYKDEIIRLGTWKHNVMRKHNANPLNQMGAKKTVKRDILGVRGEFAVAKILGIDIKTTALYNPKLHKDGDMEKPDLGYDGVYNGWTYEAKDTDHPTGRMFYQSKCHSFGQDLWILSVPIRESNSNRNDDFCCEMEIAGWLWRKDMPKLWEPCFFDPSAYCIEQSQLNSFDDLLIKRKDSKDLFFN